MFTLDQARSFIAVAEELHFGKAAERLNMTQPPLSRQIQKLERAVGVELLERDNRSVSLTPAGEAFLADARRLIVSAERAPLNARRFASGQYGELRIGFTAASGFSVLGPLLDTLSTSLPHVHLELMELITKDQVTALQNGDLDLGLARPPFDEQLFDSQLIRSEDLLLAIPQAHRLANSAEPITENDLASEPLIMHSAINARYFYDLVVRQINIDHRNVVHSVSQVLTMISLVAAGRGVAFVPESTRGLSVSGVKYVPLADVRPGIVELHAIWSKQSRNPVISKIPAVFESVQS